MTDDRADLDSPWKLILRQYLRDAIEFFFPAVVPLVDWTLEPEFLDKEFLKIEPDAEIGKRFADQLVKLQRLDGEIMVLYLHLEVQATKEEEFPRRMFVYSIRIFEVCGCHPISLAILCDGDRAWRPSSYVYAEAGTRISFEFDTVKLLDYKNQWAMLEQSPNPFAKVVMAHLKTQETSKDDPRRKDWKLRLIRQLHEEGYNGTDISNLFQFLDWSMHLSKTLKAEFWRELKQYEEERKVPYITSIEQMGYERGVEEARLEFEEARQQLEEAKRVELEEARQQLEALEETRLQLETLEENQLREKQEIALDLLQEGISVETIARITKLSIAQVQQLQEQPKA
jgi:hypothetical protein